jgi:hypothetical protein
MPADATTLQARIDALKAARDSGVLTVRHGESTVTYRSMDEIMRAITAAQADLNEIQGTPRRVAAYKFTSCKGL